MSEPGGQEKRREERVKQATGKAKRGDSNCHNYHNAGISEGGDNHRCRPPVMNMKAARSASAAAGKERERERVSGAL